MSNELVRFKYKKDIIKNIEESWDYFGKEDEMRKVIKELKNVYKIASSAKNAPKSEQEAKAKAFDDGLEAVHDRLQHILHNTDTGKLLPGYVDGMYNALDIIFECYESGESE